MMHSCRSALLDALGMANSGFSQPPRTRQRPTQGQLTRETETGLGAKAATDVIVRA